MSNVIELNKDGKFAVDYIMDENNKVIGISHPNWPFAIIRNQDSKSETAFVCDETNEPFGVLDSDVFNTVLMSWLLIDDPSLIDSARSGESK